MPSVGVLHAHTGCVRFAYRTCSVCIPNASGIGQQSRLIAPFISIFLVVDARDKISYLQCFVNLVT